MRTTIDIPEELVQEARALSHMPSKTATLIYALQELIRVKRLEELRGLRGRLDLDVDLQTLRGPRTHA